MKTMNYQVHANGVFTDTLECFDVYQGGVEDPGTTLMNNSGWTGRRGWEVLQFRQWLERG
jgi:hypothetical protein